MACFDQNGYQCSPEQELRQEAREIASQLDQGDPQYAANRLRDDIQTMSPRVASALLRQTEQLETKGYGADLQVDRVLVRNQFNQVVDTGVKDVSVYDTQYQESYPVGRINGQAQPYYGNRPVYPRQQVDPATAITQVIIGQAINSISRGGGVNIPYQLFNLGRH